MEKSPLFLRYGNQVVGPFDVEKIRLGARNGKLTPAHEGSLDGQVWFRLETVWDELVAETARLPVADKSLQADEPPIVIVESGGREANGAACENGTRDTEKPKPASATSIRPAPAYSSSLFGVLQVTLLLTGVAYLFIGLNTIFLLFQLNSGDLTSRLTMQRTLGVIAPVLELVMSAVLLAWLHNVFSRLLVMRGRFTSGKFSTLAVVYFIPVVGAVMFAAFLAKVYQASQPGKRRKKSGASQPAVIAGGLVLRLLVWTAYLAAVGDYFWLRNISARLDEARSLAYAMGEGRSAAALQRDAAAAMRPIAESIHAPTIIMIGLAVVIALGTAGVMLMNYRFAASLHGNMLIWDNPTEPASEIASTT